jgi:hypothetical protein
MTPTTPPTPPTSSRVALARSKVLNLVFTEDADKEAVREAVDELECLAYQCGAEATRRSSAPQATASAAPRAIAGCGGDERREV